MAETAKAVGPTALTTSAATLYTVPGSTTFICRLIHVANETSGPVTFTLSIGTDGAGKRFEYQRIVPPNGEFDWSGFLVVPTGTAVQGLASANTSLTIFLSGTEVT